MQINTLIIFRIIVLIMLSIKATYFSCDFLFQHSLFPFQTHNHRLMFPLYRIATHEHFVWLGHSAGSELLGYVNLLVALFAI